MSAHSTPSKGSSPNGNSILIQRFLARLSAYVGADEAESWRSDPRFHYNVTALQAFINEAEKSGSRSGGDPEMQEQVRQFMAQAQEYQGALELASVPSYVDPCRELDDSATTELDASDPDGAASEAQAKAFSALRASGPNNRLMSAQALGIDVHNRLSAQEDVQEDLTDQMAVMASQLRSQAEAQSSALHTQGMALDSAAQGLLKSVHGVSAVVSDTKTAVKRTRRSMFFFLFLLFGVSMVFLGMYGFINVTAMTQAFVPYSKVASTWSSPRAQAPSRPEAVPVTAPRAAPAASERTEPVLLKSPSPEIVAEAADKGADVGTAKDAAPEQELDAPVAPVEELAATEKDLQVTEGEEDDADVKDVDAGSIEQVQADEENTPDVMHGDSAAQNDKEASHVDAEETSDGHAEEASDKNSEAVSSVAEELNVKDSTPGQDSDTGSTTSVYGPEPAATIVDPSIDKAGSDAHDEL